MPHSVYLIRRPLVCLCMLGCSLLCQEPLLDIWASSWQLACCVCINHLYIMPSYVDDKPRVQAALWRCIWSARAFNTTAFFAEQPCRQQLKHAAGNWSVYHVCTSCIYCRGCVAVMLPEVVVTGLLIHSSPQPCVLRTYGGTVLLEQATDSRHGHHRQLVSLCLNRSVQNEGK